MPKAQTKTKKTTRGQVKKPAPAKSKGAAAKGRPATDKSRRAGSKRSTTARPPQKPSMAIEPVVELIAEPVSKAPAKVFPIEIDPSSVEATLARVREELSYWVKKGRYTKVRFKLRGKPLLPDIPIGALVAAEALTFWWAGLLRVLLVNVGAQALLDVEVVTDSDQEVGRGKLALLGGDLDRAMESFQKALDMDRDCASAHLNLGIAWKLRGDREKARGYLQKAEQLDPAGPIGEEARRLLDQLGPASGPPPGVMG